MTKEEILKRVKKFQGANREFSQELPPIIEGLVDLIDEAGPEVVDSLESSATDKALSANMGKELNVSKMDAPSVTGQAGQILQLDEEGNPEWVEAAAVGATYDSAVSDSSTNAIQNKTIKKYVDDNFAQKDGYYASLTAGAAENIVGQSAIEGTFLFRTTAGDADISNGVATVKAVKGNSVAWNQLKDKQNYSQTINDVEIVSNNDGKFILNGLCSGNGVARLLGPSVIVGHKCLMRDCFVQLYNGTSWVANIGNTDNSAVIATIPSVTFDETRTQIYVTSGVNYQNASLYPQIFDLTLMGIDNLTTVAQVESWLAANVGSKPYYPASRKLLPTKLLKYVSRGFNQWDGQYAEHKAIVASTGAETNATGSAHTDYMPILPNTAYYFRNCGINSGSLGIGYYDAGKNYISGSVIGEASGASFSRTTPNGAYYMRVSFSLARKDDICINLSWDGSRDGEYEPYVEYEYNLDVTKFYGKLNGEGDLTQIFPGGMRKADYAGTVRDLLSLKDAEADAKAGSVDLGDLSWAKSTSGGIDFFYATLNAKANGQLNIICDRYAVTDAAVSNMPNTSIRGGNSDKVVYIRDDSHASAPSIGDNWLAGVKLNYELATPEHYTDLVYRDNGVDTPVEALNVIVNNWSTEEEIIAAPEASGDPNSCAATLDILYGIDAAEQLDTINQSGIFTDDLKANLEALIGVINTNCATALGGTLSISDTPTDKVYTFTFTPTSQGE